MLPDGAFQVLQALPEPALVLGADARIAFANSVARQRLGEGVAAGADLGALGMEGDGEALRAWLRRCSGSRGALPGALNLRGANGQLTRFRASGGLLEPARDGGRARLLVRLLDGQDDRFPLLGRKLDELNREIRHRRRTRVALEAALNDRDLMLGELHHRVKNNIQMLVAMLAMSRRDRRMDAEAVLAETARRLAAVGAVHQMLYLGDNLLGVPARAFLTRIANAVMAGLGASLALRITADAVDVPNDAAVPLALVLNELLVNAVKHGCREGAAPCELHVSLCCRRSIIELRVEDNGPGIPLEAATLPGASGLKLVIGLVRQLNGGFTVETGLHANTAAVIRFPLPELCTVKGQLTRGISSA